MEVRLVPSGFRIDTEAQHVEGLSVTPLTPKLTCCPEVPSKTSRAILLVVLIVTA
jgi:hypothetical protein